MGFFDSAMRSYGFVDNLHARDRAEKRLETDRGLATEDRQRRIGWQDEQRQMLREQNELADKQRQDTADMRMLKGIQYQRQQNPDYMPSEAEAKALAPHANDPRLAQVMERIYQDPHQAKQSVTKAKAALQGKGSKQDILEFSNHFFGPYLNSGSGGTKQLTDLRAVNGQVYAELEVKRPDGSTYKAPMTSNRGTDDQLVRPLNAETGAALLDNFDELVNMALIQYGDNSPIERQDATATRQQGREDEIFKARLGLGKDLTLADVKNRNARELKKLEIQGKAGRTLNYNGKKVPAKEVTNALKQLTPLLKQYGKAAGFNFNLVDGDVEALLSSNDAQPWLEYVQGLVDSPEADERTKQAAGQYLGLIDAYLDYEKKPQPPTKAEIKAKYLQLKNEHGSDKARTLVNQWLESKP